MTATAASKGQEFRAMCAAPELRRGMTLAGLVCAGCTTSPILAHTKLTIADGIVSVAATDQDNEIRSTIAAGTVGVGSVMVPTAEMRKIVSCLSGEIEMEMVATALIIRAGATTFQLAHLLDAADYPALLPNMETPPGFVLSTAECDGFLRRTRYAVSTEETRYYLNGVNLRIGGGKLIATATDGHRLGRVGMPAPEGAQDKLNVIVPRKTAGLLSKVLQRGSEPLALAFSDDGVVGLFQRGHVTLKAKMIDGTFPDADRVIPKPEAYSKIATIPTVALAALLRRVTAACSRDETAVRLTLSPGLLQASVHGSLWGDATETMNADYAGDPIEFGINRRYLADVLKVGGTDTRLAIIDHASPLTFSDPTDASAIHVVMPMRV